MYKHNKSLKMLIALLFIVLTGFFLWDYVYLNFNPELIGYEGFGEKNYHHQNDTLRFFFLIIFCLSFFFIFFKKYYQNQIFSFKELIFLKLETKKEKDLNYITFFFLILIFAEFLGYDFSKLIYESNSIDIFHDGLQLTPSINYKYTNSFWSSSFVERGLGGNFYPVLTWFLSGNENIGSFKLFKLFCLLINKICILFICKHLIENLDYKKEIKFLFLLIFASYSISLVYYSHAGQGYFELRNFLLLFFILIMFKCYKNINNYSFINFSLGLFSCFSILWFIDIGLYINILLFLYIFVLILRKQPKVIFSVLFGIVLSWLFLPLLFNFQEIKSFYLNLLDTTTYLELLGSIKYPSPLLDFGSPLHSRATKTLIFFIFSGVGIIYLIFCKKFIKSNTIRFSLFYLFISSLITFKYGLGRSDITHIKGGSGLLIILLTFLILFYLFNLILKFKIFDKNKKIYFYLTFILSILIFSNYLNIQTIKNIYFFKTNIINLINAPNSKFLSKDYNNLVDVYKKIIADNNENCVQIFTDEIALPYYLSKKSCTKYYAMITAAPKKIQLDFINELDKIKPKIILYKSKMKIENEVESRLKLVNNYIKKKYSFYYEYEDWIFYKLNS